MAPQLGDHLKDSYSEYKQSERIVIPWAVSYARGCEQHIASQDVMSTTDGKENDMRSIKSKSTRKIAGSSNTPRHHPSIVIYEIVPFIETIAACKLLTEIPVDIATKFASILSKRLECVRWFEHHTSKDDREGRKANNNHRYPVQVLQYCLRLLKDKMPNRVAGASQQSTIQNLAESISLSNRFAALELECVEIGDDNTGLEGFTEKATVGVIQTAVIAPAPDRDTMLEEEYMFAKFCLITEGSAIEAFMAQEWINCSLDKQKLLEAALLTDVAIDFLRRREQEVEREMLEGLEDHTKLKRLATKFFDKFQRTGSDHSCEPLLRMSVVLGDFWSLSRPGDGIIYRGGVLLSHGSDYFKASAEYQAQIELFLVARISSDLLQYMAPEGKVEGTHSLLARHVAWLHRRRKSTKGPADIPLAVAFAFRLEMLAMLICGQDCDWAKQMNLKGLEHVIADTGDHLKSLNSKAVFFDNYNASDRESMLSSSGMTIDSAKAQHEIHSGQALRPFGYPLTSHTLPHFISFYFSTSTFAKATMYAGLFIPLAHLFNILKEEGAISAEWPDFDFLMHHCGEKAFFRGSCPTQSQRLDYADRFGFLTGLHTKKNIKIVQAGGWPKLEPDKYTLLRTAAMPLLTVLFDRIGHEDSFDDQYAQCTVLVLRATILQTLLGQPQKLIDMDTDSSIKNHYDLTKWAARAPPLSVVHVLALAKQRLKHELEALDFGWHQMNKAFFLLIMQLNQLWQQRDWCFVLKPDQQYSAAYQARHITMDLASNIKVSMLSTHPKQMRDHHGNLAKQQLEAAGKIFEDWLKGNGSNGVAHLSPPSQPGHLSELKPSLLKLLGDIAGKHGLRDEIFTAEQREGMPHFENTVKLKDEVNVLHAKKDNQEKPRAKV
ncbi:hypothetical protein PMZ80_010129 [Knufia obscura]|uniref:DUF6604 domain-containing protein n=2 Tax=Knufia TaxID=430999 RepID=A0AAN8ED90_9EURO|nr:hypothetical protein PMZ80_010129 [Knufia obscura]KAK5952869.1 hypothetical protein OHC33_005990 [Knufia fluminis]